MLQNTFFVFIVNSAGLATYLVLAGHNYVACGYMIGALWFSRDEYYMVLYYRSFWYAAPCLYRTNSLLIFTSLIRYSLLHFHLSHTSSSSCSSPSSLSPLASSLTRSVFHSELKNWLFGKSFPQ